MTGVQTPGARGKHTLSRMRLALWCAPVVLLVGALAPPFATAARHHDWAAALQFTTFAVVVPGLVVIGAPWRLLGLGRAAAALSEARRRHPERARSVAITGVTLVAVTAWRTPPAVDFLARQGWAVALEALTLVASGVGLWLECAPSPPLAPRSPRPMRIAMATLVMWAIWVLAYAMGMSHGDWYPAYQHLAGHGLSLIADQEIAAGLTWGVTGCCFIPLSIWNLVEWLRSDDDADEEMHRLLREERRRAT